MAATGIVLSHLTGEGAFDSAAAVIIALILAGVAWVLARESKALLLGVAATGTDDRAIRAAVARVPEAIGVRDLRTMHLAPDQILVAADIEFRHGLDTQAIEAAVDRLEAEIARELPAATRIYIEPA